MNYRNVDYTNPDELKKAFLRLACCSTSDSLGLGSELTGGDPDAVMFLDGASLVSTDTNFTYDGTGLTVAGSSTLGGVQLITNGAADGRIRIDKSYFFIQQNSNIMFQFYNNTIATGQFAALAKFHVKGTDIAVVGQIVDTPVGQTADLQQWQVNGAQKMALDASGRFRSSLNSYLNLAPGGIHFALIGDAGGNYVAMSKWSFQLALSSLTGAAAYNGINLTQTWNTTGAPTAIFTNITDTASDAASLLMDLQVGGVSMYNLTKSGTIIRPNSSAYRNNTIGGTFYFDGGNIVLRDGNSGTTTVNLKFGALTSAVLPMIKLNGTGLDIRLADDSAYSNFATGHLNVNGTDINTVGAIVNTPIGQVSNLQEWQVNGVNQAYITAAGQYNGSIKGRVLTDYINTIDNTASVIQTTSGSSDAIFHGYMLRHTDAGLTASVTQTQGNGALLAEINEVSTVATTNDTVTLPSAKVGMVVSIINNGANTLQIFPASGDNLGAGVDTATTLDAGEVVGFEAYDTTNWILSVTASPAPSSVVKYGEMYDEGNTDEFVITDAGTDFQSYHTNGLAAGDLAGWTFDAGGAGTSVPIASIGDHGGGDVIVTTTGAHGLVVGDIISQSNVADSAYAGIFEVLTVPTTTEYTITAVWGATDTGTVDQAATLIADTGSNGTYQITWSASGTSLTNNETFDYIMYNKATAIPGSMVRRKFGVSSDYGSFGGSFITTIADGDKLSLALSNEDSASNAIILNLTILAIKI